MKKETRLNALETAMNLITFPAGTMDGATKNDNFKLIPLDVLSDEGHQMFAKVSISIPDVDGSENRPAFDFNEAVHIYNSKVETAAEKQSKAKASSKKSTEAAERREERMKVLRDWWNVNAEYGVNYTPKMVYDALPELYAESAQGVMLTGSDLVQLMKEGFSELEMVDKKKTYVKR